MALKQRPETPKMVKKDTKMGKTVTHINKENCKYSNNRDYRFLLNTRNDGFWNLDKGHKYHPYEGLCDYRVPETMPLQL